LSESLLAIFLSGGGFEFSSSSSESVRSTAMTFRFVAASADEGLIPFVEGLDVAGVERGVETEGVEGVVEDEAGVGGGGEGFLG